MRRFYDLLRKAANDHSVVPTAAPRLSVGYICNQLQKRRESVRKPFFTQSHPCIGRSAHSMTIAGGKRPGGRFLVVMLKVF